MQLDNDKFRERWNSFFNKASWSFHSSSFARYLCKNLNLGGGREIDPHQWVVAWNLACDQDGNPSWKHTESSSYCFPMYQKMSRD